VTVVWPCACEPVVATGQDRDGRPVVVWLHAVDCTQPTEARRSIVLHPRAAA
jgi:hypothetical protein